MIFPPSLYFCPYCSSGGGFQALGEGRVLLLVGATLLLFLLLASGIILYAISQLSSEKRSFPWTEP
jgi:hypothetical protein